MFMRFFRAKALQNDVVGEQPITIFQIDHIAGEGFFGADDDFVRVRADFYHVKRRVVFGYAAADADAFALADCVMDDAVMLRQNGAVLVNDVAGFFSFRADFFDHFCVIAMWDEADVLTVWFIGGEEA